MSWLSRVHSVRLATAIVACGSVLGARAGDDDQQGNRDPYIVAGPVYLSFTIDADADDGTEVNASAWHADGYAGSDCNRLGAADGESYAVGLRFHLREVCQGESFAYARLVIPARDDGAVDSVVRLRIVGVDQDSPNWLNSALLSQLPQTDASIDWELHSNWPGSAADTECVPLYRYSDDISPIINEIVGRPDWGSGANGRTLALVIQDSGSAGGSFLGCWDYHEIDHAGCPGTVVAPVLELYRTVRDTFFGRELLGRPTARSVTVTAFSLLTLEAYVEHGPAPGDYTAQTAPVVCNGGTPLEVLVDGLVPNTRYYYRLRYRRPGGLEFAAGPAGTFHTQRPPGEAFTFTVQADSEIQHKNQTHDWQREQLYQAALRNALADEPDFHLDLGDTFHCESYSGRDVLDLAEAVKRHLDQRPFFGLICHSAPLFCVLGNHEGEQGWRLDGTPDNVAVWATHARKLLYPLPVPDDFYTGSSEDVTFTGLRENYYAWEWGDALFVVLDPYWYTTRKPHSLPLDGPPGSGDNWDWTLGHTQYDWLRATLAGSAATFKFVFAHQVTGGVTTYGRGGAEAASHALGRRGSFEWGGQDLLGNDVFDLMRRNWGAPVHDVLVDNRVTIFFHGHDHLFARQELDRIVYQECPQPSDITYGWGHAADGRYHAGLKLPNSGHLRVRVSPSAVTVEYVRAYLPGDGPNGEVADSYSPPAPGQP